MLLACFSVALIPPALFVESESKLPACCRKDGKHCCSMTAAPNGRPSSAGAGVVREKCPSFPQSRSTSPSGRANGIMPRQTFFAAILSHPALHAQTEARYRVAFSRARQKRGPPEILS